MGNINDNFSGDGFQASRDVIIYRLSKIEDSITNIEQKLENMTGNEIVKLKIEINTLKTKMMFVGVASGIVSSAIASVLIGIVSGKLFATILPMIFYI